VLVVSLFVCPLATGGYGLGLSRPAEARQIEFTPHVSTLEADATQQAAILATVGPGQSFEDDDPRRPEIETIAGDERFGYGFLTENPELYAVWVTDENGTHYLIVEETSEVVRGAGDMAGFARLIADRADKLDEIATAANDRDTHNNTAFLSAGLGVGLLIGGAICIAASFGLCAVPAAAGFGAAWLAFSSQSDARTDQNRIDTAVDGEAGLHSLEAQMQSLHRRGQLIGSGS